MNEISIKKLVKMTSSFKNLNDLFRCLKKDIITIEKFGGTFKTITINLESLTLYKEIYI